MSFSSRDIVIFAIPSVLLLTDLMNHSRAFSVMPLKARNPYTHYKGSTYYVQAIAVK
jgi:hypothetical protein